MLFDKHIFSVSYAQPMLEIALSLSIIVHANNGLIYAKMIK